MAVDLWMAITIYTAVMFGVMSCFLIPMYLAMENPHVGRERGETGIQALLRLSTGYLVFAVSELGKTAKLPREVFAWLTTERENHDK